MIERRIVLQIALTTTLLSSAAQPARAGDGFEAAGGYAYLSIGTCSAQTCTGDSSETLTRGWFVSAGSPIATRWALVAEASGSYESTSDSVGGVTATSSLKVHTFLGGSRFVYDLGTARGLRVFGQLLAGVASTSTGITGIGLEPIDIHAVDNAFCYQPGGGLDVGLGGRTAVRIGANLRFVHESGLTSKQLQFVAGMVYRFRKERTP